MLDHYSDSLDVEILDRIAVEIADTARALVVRHPLNRHSDFTARGDCLRLLRAAIELAPTVPPDGY